MKITDIEFISTAIYYRVNEEECGCVEMVTLFNFAIDQGLLYFVANETGDPQDDTDEEYTSEQFKGEHENIDYESILIDFIKL